MKIPSIPRLSTSSRRKVLGACAIVSALALAGCVQNSASSPSDTSSPSADTGTCINCTQVMYNGKPVNALFAASDSTGAAWFTMQTPESKDTPSGAPLPDPSPTALTQAIGYATESGGNPTVNVIDLTPWLNQKGIQAGSTWSIAAAPKSRTAYIGIFGTKPKPDGTADTKGYVLKMAPTGTGVPTINDLSLFATMDQAFTAVTPAQVGQPYGLSVDNAGNVYISDIQNDQIERLPANYSGNVSDVKRFPVPKNAPPDPCATASPHGGVDGLTDFAVAPDGSIGYATAQDASSVYKINLTSGQIDIIPFVDPATQLSGKPSWVTMAPGNIPFFTYSGGVAQPTGSASPTCVSPTASPTGSSSPDSGQRGGDGVAYVDANNKVHLLAAGTAESAKYLGVTASPNGWVYTSSLENSQVLGTSASNPGGLQPIALFTTGNPGPWGLAPTPNGAKMWITYKNIGYIGWIVPNPPGAPTPKKK